MGELPENKRDKHVLEIIAENEKPISNLVDKFNQTIENISNQFIKHQERETRFSFRMSGLLAVLVMFIVSIAAILTYYNKVDGSTFTFLLGLVVGYVLTFFTGLIYPSE